MALATPGRSMAMRGGACTENPFGTAVSASLSSMRTTSDPACWLLVIDWMAFCAQATPGAANRLPARASAAIAAVAARHWGPWDMVRLS